MDQLIFLDYGTVITQQAVINFHFRLLLHDVLHSYERILLI